ACLLPPELGVTLRKPANTAITVTATTVTTPATSGTAAIAVTAEWCGTQPTTSTCTGMVTTPDTAITIHPIDRATTGHPIVPAATTAGRITAIRIVRAVMRTVTAGMSVMAGTTATTAAPTRTESKFTTGEAAGFGAVAQAATEHGYRVSIRQERDACERLRAAHTSTLAASALSWMKSRRGSTNSPISLVKRSSASSVSFTFTCSSERTLESSVVSQSC